MSTVRESAERWLKSHPHKCVCCGNEHFWFTGIEVQKIYPDGYVDSQSFSVPLQTARFVCNNPGCGAVLHVDTAAAHLGAPATSLAPERLEPLALSR